jgi:hypothetical protein
MSETARVALAFLLAIPIGVYAPALSVHWLVRLVVTAALFALVLVPADPPVTVYLCAAAATLALAALKDSPKALFPSLALAMLAALLFSSASEVWDAIDSLASSDDVITVAAGWAVTVFAGGALIGLTVPMMLGAPPGATPISQGDRGPETPEGHPGAGRAIGWLERSLVFAFVLAGVPEAAAIVFAAKSIARFASLDQRPFAEYYLIGSLASVAVAVAGAAATRAILGEPVL